MLFFDLILFIKQHVFIYKLFNQMIFVIYLNQLVFLLYFLLIFWDPRLYEYKINASGVLKYTSFYLCNVYLLKIV